MVDYLRMGTCPITVDKLVKTHFPNFEYRTGTRQVIYSHSDDPISMDIIGVDNKTLPPEYQIPNRYNLLLYLRSEDGRRKTMLEEIVKLFETQTGIKTVKGPEKIKLKLRTEKEYRLQQEQEKLRSLLMDPFF